MTRSPVAARAEFVLGPDRGVGVTEALGTLLSEPLVVLSALVTQLGDPWLYFVVLTALYLLAGRSDAVDRDRAAFLIALAVGVVAVTTGLKYLFAYPRPPAPETAPGLDLVPSLLQQAYVEAVLAEGFGFPSGHALGATGIWGGTALVVDVWTRKRRLQVAGAVIAVVSLTRLTLGVHYLADVVAGVVLGVAYLAVAYRIADGGRAPGRAFDLGVVAAALCLLVAGVGFEPAAILGAAVGGWATWRVVGAGGPPDRPLAPREAGVGLGVAVAAAAGFVALYSLRPIAPVAFLGGAVVLAGVLAAPLVGQRVAAGRPRRTGPESGS